MGVLIKQVLKYFILLSLIFTFNYKFPKIQHSYIKNYVGNKTVYVTAEKGRPGGTGVHIKTPHGNIVILTNAHVCNGTQKDGIVYITTEDGIKMPRRVLEISNWTDLCVVEAIPGINGISLGNEPHKGDNLIVVGHPYLRPLTISEGELINKEIVQVLDHQMNPDDLTDKCDLPKNKIIEDTSGFFPGKYCIDEIMAYETTVTTFPGNSGSPVVDQLGNLIALVFASNSQTFQGDFVTLPDIQKFITPY